MRRPPISRLVAFTSEAFDRSSPDNPARTYLRKRTDVRLEEDITSEALWKLFASPESNAPSMLMTSSRTSSARHPVSRRMVERPIVNPRMAGGGMSRCATWSPRVAGSLDVSVSDRLPAEPLGSPAHAADGSTTAPLYGNVRKTLSTLRHKNATNDNDDSGRGGNDCVTVELSAALEVFDGE